MIQPFSHGAQHYLPRMLRTWPALLIVGVLACRTPHYDTELLRNRTIKDHLFLETLRNDARYPDHVANKCEDLLIHLCFAIEAEEVTEAEQLHPLAQHTISEMNKLLIDFELEGVSLDDQARQELSAEFTFIAKAYGIPADEHRLLAPKSW